MEPNRFLFKLTAIFFQYIAVILVFMPLVFLSQLLKYKFQTEEIAFIRVLFFSVALAMPFAVANAFSFANFEKIDLKYYLKSNQVHKVVTPQPTAAVIHNAVTRLSQKPFWKLKNQSSDSITFVVKNLILTDEVSLHCIDRGDGTTELEFESKPRQSYIFLDFGRNYRNILRLLQATQPQI